MENTNEFLNMLAARSAEKYEPTDGDYIGEDGLIYCGTCRTPRQCIPNKATPNFKPFCLCKCRIDKKRKEEKEIASRNEREARERARKCGIKDNKLLSYTFGSDLQPDSETSKRLRRYANNYKEAYKENIGLLLWGDSGVGKSFYAGCIANYIIDSGQRVLCTTIPIILNDLFSAVNKNEYINDIISYQFLIIDDLGSERGTTYATEQLFTIIDERYKTNKPTIITTNLSPKEMQNTQGIEYKRIYSRIIEMCVPLHISGDSRRDEAGKTKAQKLAEILRG